MYQLTRREALQSSLALMAGGFLSTSKIAAIEPIRRHGKVPIRLSIAGYSYRAYFTGKRKPAMTLEDFVDLAADIGFDAVEPTAYYFKDTSNAYLVKLRNRCIRLGLDISGGAVGNNFCHRDSERLKREIDQVKQWIDRYAVLGAKTIRIFAGRVAKGDNEAAALKRCIDAIGQACDYAGKKGIYLALENHGGVTATPEQMLKIIRGVKHDWFGVNLDTGNFHTSDPYADLAKIAPYAVNVQLKTELRAQGKKTEEADLAKLIQILKKVNYRGYVALEYEAAEDPKKAIPHYAKTLKKLLTS